MGSKGAKNSAYNWGQSGQNRRTSDLIASNLRTRYFSQCVNLTSIRKLSQLTSLKAPNYMHYFAGQPRHVTYAQDGTSQVQDISHTSLPTEGSRGPCPRFRAQIMTPRACVSPPTKASRITMTCSSAPPLAPDHQGQEARGWVPGLSLGEGVNPLRVYHTRHTGAAGHAPMGHAPPRVARGVRATPAGCRGPQSSWRPRRVWRCPAG